MVASSVCKGERLQGLPVLQSCRWAVVNQELQIHSGSKKISVTPYRHSFVRLLLPRIERLVGLHCSLENICGCSAAWEAVVFSCPDILLFAAVNLLCVRMDLSNKSGSSQCFQSPLCGGKGTDPHCSVLVCWVLVALQNQLQNHQKVANAWCSLHPRDVSLIYPASVSISPLITCAPILCANGLNLVVGRIW